MKIITLQAELERELAKRDRIRERQLARYSEGSATRRRTTTSNAEADAVRERRESYAASLGAAKATALAKLSEEEKSALGLA